MDITCHSQTLISLSKDSISESIRLVMLVRGLLKIVNQHNGKE